DLKEFALKRRKLAPQMGEISLLDIEETQEKFPFLNGNYYSLFIEGAARVDGRALREALISNALEHGAKYVEGEAELIHNRDKVTGVNVGKKTINADMVIAAN